jgi:hypothetical protein
MTDQGGRSGRRRGLLGARHRAEPDHDRGESGHEDGDSCQAHENSLAHRQVRLKVWVEAQRLALAVIAEQRRESDISTIPV